METREAKREAYLLAADGQGNVPGRRFYDIREGARHPDTSVVRDLEQMKRRKTDRPQARAFLSIIHAADLEAFRRLYGPSTTSGEFPAPQRVA